MKTVFLCLGCLLIAGCGLSSRKPAVKLEEETVDGILLKPASPVPGLQVLVPAEFAKMDAATIATKYPAANRPSLVYTNETGGINVAFNHTGNKVPASALKQLHTTLDSSIRQTQPNATWMYSGIRNYHGREWCQLEFQSQAIDTTIHNMMLATSANGTMLVLTFNCTDKDASQWLGVGRAIIESAVFNE